MRKVARKLLRAVANYDPAYYDMYADQNEAFFAQLYVAPIMEHAAARQIRPPATVLEAGCQTGRLVVPFAQLGFAVTGIDTSGFALRRAKKYAAAAGVQAAFLQGDLLKVLRGRGARYDLVVCAEVVYLSSKYREMLQVLAESVRPGGLLCVSHRPKSYYFLESLRQQDVESAMSVVNRTEGPWRGSAYYNWQTEEELQALYGSLGLEWIALRPIDRLSWLSGISPSQLSQAQRRHWLEAELREAGEGGECARYVLVIAAKPSMTNDQAPNTR
ncbi:MAG: methyltransferase domain-containing protein [Candidatus Omnitrophica bacterium]|nr:methyltransferase domain-containing protein [Candidatus Omnitrophota bacterium]